MRVLIVGCGYVGLALGAELVRRGHAVFGLRRTSGGDASMNNAGVAPVHADVSRRDQLDRLPGPFDWIVNTASSGRSGMDAYRQVYLEGAKNLVDWLGATPPRRYIYTSSTGVYTQDDGSVVTEDSPAQPETDTSKILLETEQALLAAAPVLPAVVLRVAGIYGPDRGHFYRQFLRGEARIPGRGERHLNMIHRDDVAGAIIAALEKGAPGQIYNAVDDEPVSLAEFFQWLSERLNRPMPPFVAPDERPAKRAVTNKRVSNRRLKEELGYAFCYPTFREGYESLIEA